MKYSLIKIYRSGERGYGKVEKKVVSRYQKNKILKKGGVLKKKPEILIALETREEILGTFGIFINEVPSKKIFDFSCPHNSIELGRLTVKEEISMKERLNTLRRIFKVTALFLITNHRYNIIIVTPPQVKKLLKIIYKKDVLVEKKSRLKKRKIPPESFSFYAKKNPKVYQVKNLMHFL